ncbi:uncharacterized protein C2845_PM13G12340 [Panicum miliaceum]|uniref:Uncharacterized protein n=1 Tax=Panicum miliaceum TaxID=4540 RepID=A0A3L6RHW2_PANMI|nr:uncharacterized protein C2845_PM13G12340 [Panicum miliaceum]
MVRCGLKTRGHPAFRGRDEHHVHDQVAFRAHEPAGGRLLATAGGPERPRLPRRVKGAAAGEDNDKTCCWGTCPCTSRRVWELPFPQDRVLTVRYQEGGRDGSNSQESVVFVPVAGQPLASNRYYAVVAKGRRKGLVRACFCRCVKDAEPRPFDPADVYQQIEVVPARASRGGSRRGPSPPTASRRPSTGASTGKCTSSSSPRTSTSARRWGSTPPRSGRASSQPRTPLHGGGGDDSRHRREMGVAPREQIGCSAFYKVVLEQRWEPVSGDAVGCAHDYSKLASKTALIGGSVEAKVEGRSSRHVHAYVWFVAATGRVGVCTTVWERMLWEETNGGWVDEEVEAGSVADGSVLVAWRGVKVKAEMV